MTRREKEYYPSVLKLFQDTEAFTGFARIATDYFHEDSFLAFHAVETPPPHCTSTPAPDGGMQRPARGLSTQVVLIELKGVQGKV